MMTIYKYPIQEIADEVTVKMPAGAQILKAGEQDGVITLWARVNTEHPLIDFKLYIMGTGHPEPVPSEGHFLSYLDSVFVGQFVWHLLVEEEVLTHELH